VDTRRGFIEVDDGRLEALWCGPGPEQAPTLVFLHHGLGCVDTWRDFPAELARATGFGALVYSREGYGGSDACALPRPPTYMHAEALEVLPRVLEATEIRECVLVGHSDGGSIALVYAGGTPAPTVRGLITEAAHIFLEDISVRGIEQARRDFTEGKLREALERHHGANTDCAFHGWCDGWLQPAFRDFDLEEYLPAVRVPWLVIQGEDDAYGTLAQVESIVKGADGPTETLILEGCGHDPHREQPEVVLERMARFVRALPRRGAADQSSSGSTR